MIALNLSSMFHTIHARRCRTAPGARIHQHLAIADRRERRGQARIRVTYRGEGATLMVAMTRSLALEFAPQGFR